MFVAQQQQQQQQLAAMTRPGPSAAGASQLGQASCSSLLRL